MKNIPTILPLLIALFESALFSSCHRPTPQKPPGNDTVFLINETKSDPDKVYIEKNRNSAEYKSLLNFNLDSDKKKQYLENCKSLAKIAVKVSKEYVPMGLPKYWVAVEKHAGKYYIYSPAEDGAENRLIVTDTTVCFMSWDGFMPEQILSVTNKHNRMWNFVVNSTINGKHGLIAQLIDAKTGLTVWGYFNKSESNLQLYVPIEKAYNFDMIVNRGGGGVKVPEYMFDRVDFKSLMEAAPVGN